MNDHHIELLAAALNAARPDWPIKSLRTFITTHLASRPYRDAFVALAWVATDPNTASPARVLEAGPWWRAAAVDQAVANLPDRLDRSDRCRICGKSQHDCVRSLSSEHTFEPDWVPNPEQRAHVDIAQVRRELAGGGS